MDNFDLKKFLVENKLTENSKLNEIKAVPGSTGTRVNLLSFIKQNQDEIANKIGAVRLEDIDIDTLGDVGALAMFNLDVEIDNDFGYNFISGVSFRYPKDVDDNFKGENGDKPLPLEIAGKQLMYVSYNI